MEFWRRDFTRKWVIVTRQDGTFAVNLLLLHLPLCLMRMRLHWNGIRAIKWLDWWGQKGRHVGCCSLPATAVERTCNDLCMISSEIFLHFFFESCFSCKAVNFCIITELLTTFWGCAVGYLATWTGTILFILFFYSWSFFLYFIINIVKSILFI